MEFEFLKKEQDTAEKTRETFSIFYPTYWKGIKHLKDAVSLLINENESEKDPYVNATLLLVNRSMQHMEGIRLLIEAGLYGDAFSLSRNMTSDIAMIQYLRYKPELIDSFLKETKNEYQNKNSSFSKNFSEGTIHKVLVENGVSEFKGVFQILSKASHASAFGSQLYGSRGEEPNKYHLKYGPGFESDKALGLLAILQSGPFDLLDNILLYRSNKKPGEKRPPEWAPIDNALGNLSSEIDMFSNAAIKTIETIKDWSYKKESK